MIGRKLLQIISLPLIMLLQASCSAAQSQPAATPELSGTPFSSQKFTVIPVYEGMDSYAEAVRATSHPDWNALFRKYVVDPYWQDCAAGGDLLNKDAATTPIKDIDYLTTAVGILRESNVEQIVQGALQKAAKALPGPNTTVCILVADSQPTFVKDYMNGVLGSNVGAGKIWLQIYPSGSWRDWVPYAVAHEYHHSVWINRHGSQFETADLVDDLVVEGKADSFARLLYPDAHAPWTEALTPEQEQNQWQAMQKYLHARSSDTQQKFMFGGLVGSNHVPLWTGYTIGFHIVQSYLHEHPDVTIAEWTMMDAHDLLDQSGYAGK
jgi:uncharacterized protein YjaZ